MGKCIATLQNVQTFARLNSLDTVRRMIEKLLEKNTKELSLLALSRVKVIERQANFEKLVRFVQDESGEQTGSMDK